MLENEFIVVAQNNLILPKHMGYNGILPGGGG